MGASVSRETAQSEPETHQAVIAPGKAKTQQGVFPIELAHPDVLARQMLMQVRSLAVANQPVKRCATDVVTVTVGQNLIQLPGLVGQARAHLVGPWHVRECGPTDRECRPGRSPWTQRALEKMDDWLGSNSKAQSHTSQPIELAKGPQDHHWQLRAKDRGTLVRHDVNERLVYNQPTVATGSLFGQLAQGFHWQQSPVRVVGINHNQVGLITPRANIGDIDHAAVSLDKGAGVFVVRRPKNRRAAFWGKSWHPLDQSLRSGGSDKANFGGNTVSFVGRLKQRFKIALGRQSLPETRYNLRQWIGMRIDTGGQIEPFGSCSPKQRTRFRQITTMQHQPDLPLLRLLRQWVMAVLGLLLNVGFAAAQSMPPARVISLNMCTDQLLLDLADPAQIAGLSPFAADAARSFLAARVQALPIMSGTAEEVMVLRPDLVVAGTFTKRATREFIRARGVNLEEFAPVRSLAETKRQITRFGEITGAQTKAVSRNIELDAALVELRAAASKQKLRVLPLARRAWVPGSSSLMSELLTQAGLVNAAGELGIRTGGRTTLEAIIMLKPDAILISRDDGEAEDQGRALLLHPAIQNLFPPERRIVIPERLTVCGGPMLVEAMRTLSRQISQLKPREAEAP